jgi:hypothetical protein
MTPSWKASRLPPGKTWAEANEVDVRTRWRRRVLFWGERRRMEALGRGGGGGFLWVEDGRDMMRDGDEDEGEYGVRNGEYRSLAVVRVKLGCV